ncbi:MAG TPA: NAD-dependent epimerase/dehydratase family protein [Dehalococcoidia bacterium]|nr:NAD-dependent epimerase/dehydratase family protein [Dehalococcoidia bacterium]
MTRVLVTGGAGFLGRHLVDALLARGDDVTILDNFRRSEPEGIPPAVRLFEGDIRDPAAVQAAMEGAELVFHLAAQSNVMGSSADPDYAFATNVMGTYNVLRAARAAGVRRVVFSSSREAYGEPAALPVAEDTPLGAKNAYGASKIAGEAYCRVSEAEGGPTCSILRFANVYGPGDRERVIPLWLDRAVRGEPLELYGGSQVLDFVWVGIAVECLLAAGERDLDGPVNVGSGTGTSLTELAERIRSLTGGRSELKVLPARPIEVTRFVADTTRMRRVLGIQPPEDPLFALPSMLPLLRTTATRT